MVKGSIAVGCGLLLLGGWQAPSAGAAGAAVGGVELAWGDATHAKIRITWTETTPVANALSLETDGDSLSLGSVPASAPNELLVNTSYLGYTITHGVSKILVTDPSGGQASSPGFDRYSRPAPLPTLTFAPQGGVKWDGHADADEDTTPNDPLDLDGTTQYVARMRLDKQPHTYGDCGEALLPATKVPNGVLPDLGKPTAVAILTSNEWNPKPRGADEGIVETSKLTIAAPTVTSYGTSVTLTGLGGHSYVAPGGGVVCRQLDYPMSGERIALQSRNSPTGPWYVVGNSTTDSGSRYSFSVKNPGAREYRVVQPGMGRTNWIRYGATSATKFVKATTRVVSARFISPVISYGTKPQAYLWVDPAGSQKAALQFKNSSGAWQGVTYKTLYSGRGLVALSWSRRGATQFRWWVPGSTTSTGLRVEPVYSGIFTLTVR
jgi:phenolic acid decarboxylase